MKYNVRFLILPIITITLLSSCVSEKPVLTPGPSLFSVKGDSIMKNGKPFFIKGVVYVPAYPGFLPWELEPLASEAIPAQLKASIRKDMAGIRNLGANAVRFWGCPAFCHQAVKETEGLHFLQTIWFDGAAPDFQDGTYKASCKNYIRDVVDRIYSVYTDSPPPLVAYVLGNELSRESILNTDSLHPGIKAYKGTYIKTEAPVTATEVFLAEMADYLKTYELMHYKYQNLITYANEIRTYDIIDTPFLDFRSHNAYSYAVPYYLPRPPTGSSTRTHFQGWIELVKDQHPGMPLLITETGLSVSPNAPHAGSPDYGYGGNTEAEQAQGITQNITDILTAKRPLAGVIVHEYLDAWWKYGLEDSYTQDPNDIEEWFGIVRIVKKNGWYETENRPVISAIRALWE
ncbi:MAG: hypothetical protein JW969_01215 [Spirochaetales bacterium]|nr:hypothetical protein [Spirochaetales bacterium]